MYRSTKTYGPEVGLSACFRQWRADSHCSYLHGYALSFSFVFEADELDKRGWVVDFGALKELKDKLVQTFDHKLVVAADDPELSMFKALAKMNVADVLVLPDGVGCEKFAKLAYDYAAGVVSATYGKRVRVISCECREHGANSAIYVAGKQ
jgi:6-pyruvoyltetrahydropterin/6-carboxytetrahydropterin synthase